ncbi:caspase family protein, partial [Hyalangium sp.]|uniref:caspase family protein n=1 Tax=Hyalangium sp. TaxID=2028555 RepID=UPI002D680A8F
MGIWPAPAMSPTHSPLHRAGFERSLAVVVGVNTYSHGVPPLHNAVRDATAVADTLEQQDFEVIRLLDSQASLEALSDLLSNHLPSLQPPLDRLLIYFAGHGLAHTNDQHQLSGFLLPADARRDVPSSYWPMASLREALRRLPCRHLLLILDCCFAGAFPHTAVRDLRPAASCAPLYLERFRHFTSHRSFQLLLSTAHDELASDRLLAKPSQETLGDGQHSPFALALLQALQTRSPADFNEDGLLTASELYTFLRDRLVSLLPSHHQQTPSLWNLDWHDGGEFLFCLTGALPDLPPAAPLSKNFNPYLGLRPFSEAHRHLFFGRERGIGALCEHLRLHPLLLLCGPSGAGKSSLVHAGLLPRLSETSSWQAPPSLRPSARPLHALAAWLSSLAPAESSPSAATLASRPETARDFLCTVLSRRPGLSLLLVIDPLEELITACLENHRREAFLRALSSILQLAHPRLRAVLLLRSDFEPHFLSLLPAASFLLQLWHSSRVTVPPMNRDELRRCIEKPAEARTLFFTPGLVERLLDDVEQMPGALPLLSVALSELFDAHLDSGREDRTLSFADYDRLGGGIAGALQRRAELVFSGAPPPLS